MSLLLTLSNSMPQLRNQLKVGFMESKWKLSSIPKSIDFSNHSKRGYVNGLADSRFAKRFYFQFLVIYFVSSIQIIFSTPV
jgi:hypothetical protein